ncbi:unnamed protein product [Gongylonema pulchrum]|uniref:TLC domain-containing protein n=1 Tax=Gongylonema pulchrum TaxID=637853 RepID=A0A183E4L6_9BILA|nr:unnamed protein product [Gongylonema pulchrum]
MEGEETRRNLFELEVAPLSLAYPSIPSLGLPFVNEIHICSCSVELLAYWSRIPHRFQGQAEVYCVGEKLVPSQVFDSLDNQWVRGDHHLMHALACLVLTSRHLMSNLRHGKWHRVILQCIVVSNGAKQQPFWKC